MRAKLSILLSFGLALLLSAASARAVTLSDFSCTGDSDSHMCAWGEDNLSAELTHRRAGLARLQFDMADDGMQIADVFLAGVADVDGLRITSIRETLREGLYNVRYEGDFGDLVEHVRVGVDMQYDQRHRAHFVSSAIPEPSAAMVFALGALILGARLRF